MFDAKTFCLMRNLASQPGTAIYRAVRAANTDIDNIRDGVVALTEVLRTSAWRSA
jgi:hypothetical protein